MSTQSLITIIGTGFGGLCMAIRLKQAGIHDFVMLEKAGGVGGTWRDNTYPGAACDVQSHLYSFSFEPKHDWSRKFGRQQEILEYMEHCADKYGLLPHIRFNKEVVTAAFDGDKGGWTIETQDGETVSSIVLVTACGQLNRPAMPRLPGLADFQGRAFHSARWEHDYDFTGKTVAVIGTGASAIQFVPELVPQVAQMKLFQRSGAWVVSKADRPFTALEQQVFAWVPLADRLYRNFIYWKNESRALAFTRMGGLLELFALEARWMARRQVKDREKRRQLIPDYKIGCKRILLSNDWYKALNQAHVSLVSDDICHVTRNGIVTQNGEHHRVDVIVYGTGFQATEFLSPMKITGLDGRCLNEAWRDGAEAYKGINVSGFPNLFMLYGPNTNLAHSSIVFMLESQVRYVMQCLQALRSHQLKYLDVKAKRQAQFGDALQKELQESVWASGCSSWYHSASGKNTNNWPGFTFRYRLLTRQVNLQDYELVKAPASWADLPP